MFTANEAKEMALRKIKEEKDRKAAREAARKARKWNIFDSIELIQTLFWIKREAKAGELGMRHHIPTRPRVCKKLEDNGYRVSHYYGGYVLWEY